MPNPPPRHDVLETQLLAPLYAEALQFVVRADSPWRTLNQISASARVNVGPAGGARAATAAAAGSALFGAQWRPRRLDHDALRLLPLKFRKVPATVEEWKPS